MFSCLKQRIFIKKFTKKYQTKIFPTNIFNLDVIESIGKHSYGPIFVQTGENLQERLSIGSFVSIADNVVFQLGGNHPYNRFSTYPLMIDDENMPKLTAYSKGPIIIKNDVWIGSQSLILSGVTLAQGTIVAAGSVVTKSTQPYSIVGGNPAKLLRFRFSEQMICLCLDILDYSKISDDIIKENCDLFSSELTMSSLKKIKEILWSK